MLVLTRKADQKIRIGNDIVITILKVQGEQVSIGIEAPKELQIVREELLADSQLSDSAIRTNRKSVIKQKKQNSLFDEV
jgi:carbon storage regulator